MAPIATTILLAFTAASLVSASDSDCPNGYSGYSLKTGTNCQQYVYCANGVISGPWQTCPGGLLFNGGVGKGGICDWAHSVNCQDPTLTTGGGGGAQQQQQQQQVQQIQSQQAVVVVQQTPRPTPYPTRYPTRHPTPRPNPSVNNNNNSNNPENYFCGSSMANAAQICQPCPSGSMLECADDYSHGCFKGVTACASTTSSSSSSSGGTASASSGGGGGSSSSGGGSTTSNNNNNINDGFNLNMDNVVDSYLSAQQQNFNDWLANQQSQSQQQQQTQPQQSQQTTSSYQQQQPQTTTTTFNQPQNNYQPQYTTTTSNTNTQTTSNTINNNNTPSKSPTLPPWTNAPFNPTPAHLSSPDKTVIGYYASWQWYDRNKYADPNNINFSKYDRINYAFFQPCPEGNLYGTDEWADPQLLFGPYIYNTAQQTPQNYYCSWDGPRHTNCNYHDTSRGLMYLAHRAGVEVMPSIGGWTLSDNFPGIAASASRRENFAQQCVELIMAYGFDGIDIDWEYPGYEDHSGTPADTVNFTLLLRAVRNKLDQLGAATGKYYGLTAALPCGPDKIDKIEVNNIANILTELNLMSYDMHGSWDTLTGTNAPMFDQGYGDKSPRWSTHGCVNTYVELGVPLRKMNIGLPFYGRSFQRATGMKQFHGGADDINFHLDEGSPQYFNIVNQLKKMTTYRHENTQTQYAVFNGGSRGLVSYDDARAICDKVDYANKRGMHGFLIWEISGDMIDMNGQMITPLIDATNQKIRNPNFPCHTLRDPTWALGDQTYRYAPDEPDTIDWSNYIAPISSGGSANDFNGAVVGNGGSNPVPVPAVYVPAPTPPTNTYYTPQNYVYVPPAQTTSSVGSSSSGSSSSSSGGGCPPGHTGYVGIDSCTRYANCQNGSIVGATQPCAPGTLFDVSIGVCMHASSVQC